MSLSSFIKNNFLYLFYVLYDKLRNSEKDIFICCNKIFFSRKVNATNLDSYDVNARSLIIFTYLSSLYIPLIPSIFIVLLRILLLHASFS